MARRSQSYSTLTKKGKYSSFWPAFDEEMAQDHDDFQDYIPSDQDDFFDNSPADQDYDDNFLDYDECVSSYLFRDKGYPEHDENQTMEMRERAEKVRPTFPVTAETPAAQIEKLPCLKIMALPRFEPSWRIKRETVKKMDQEHGGEPAPAPSQPKVSFSNRQPSSEPAAEISAETQKTEVVTSSSQPDPGCEMSAKISAVKPQIQRRRRTKAKKLSCMEPSWKIPQESKDEKEPETQSPRVKTLVGLAVKPVVPASTTDVETSETSNIPELQSDKDLSEDTAERFAESQEAEMETSPFQQSMEVCEKRKMVRPTFRVTKTGSSWAIQRFVKLEDTSAEDLPEDTVESSVESQKIEAADSLSNPDPGCDMPDEIPAAEAQIEKLPCLKVMKLSRFEPSWRLQCQSVKETDQEHAGEPAPAPSQQTAASVMSDQRPATSVVLDTSDEPSSEPAAEISAETQKKPAVTSSSQPDPGCAMLAQIQSESVIPDMKKISESPEISRPSTPRTETSVRLLVGPEPSEATNNPKDTSVDLYENAAKLSSEIQKAKPAAAPLSVMLAPLPPLRKPLTSAPVKQPQPTQTSKKLKSEFNVPVGLPAAVVPTTAERLESGLMLHHQNAPHEQSAAVPHPGLKALLYNSATEESADPIRVNPTQNLLIIPEKQFHQTLDSQDQQISALAQQNKELVLEVKRLYSLVNLSSIKQSVASQKRQNLKSAIVEEQMRRDVAESSLAQLQEEATQVQAKLTQARVQLQDSQRDANNALLMELEKLREQMSLQKSASEKDTAVLYAEIRKQNQQHADVSGKVSQLEASLRAERTTATRAEACLAQQVEETAELKASLERVQHDIKDQQQRWKQEECDLLAEQNKAKSIMKTAVMEKQEHLEKQRQKWEKEKSSLLETISTLTETLAEEEAEEERFKDILMDRIANLEKFLKKKKHNRPLPEKHSSR